MFPNRGDVTDVIVQPINAVLSLPYLSEYADVVVCYDNNSLGRVSALRYREEAASELGSHYRGHNIVAAQVMADITASLRFPQA